MKKQNKLKKVTKTLWQKMFSSFVLLMLLVSNSGLVNIKAKETDTLAKEVTIISSNAYFGLSRENQPTTDISDDNEEEIIVEDNEVSEDSGKVLQDSELPPALLRNGRNIVPDARKVEQVSVIRFVAAETLYLGGMALDDGGKVWTWGWNGWGELGNDSVINGYAGGISRIPYFVDNNIHIVQIAAGYHTCLALDDQGVVYAWGHGANGQMGNNTITGNNTSPKIVTSLDGIKIKKVVISTEINSTIYALAENGDVYAWGYADGNRIPGLTGSVRNATLRNYFGAIPAGVSIVDIDFGMTHGIVLDSTGQVWTWGANGNGQLGHGNTTAQTTAKRVEFFNEMSIKNISAESNTTVVVTTDGVAYKWGRDYHGTGTRNRRYQGPYGDYYYWSGGASSNITSPVKVNFDLSSSDYPAEPEVAFGTAGRYVSYVTDVYGRVWFWGNNYAYSFGTDGVLFDSPSGKYNNYVTDATLLKSMGDGDTEVYNGDSIAKGPVFEGAIPAGRLNEFVRSYTNFGQWTPMDGLHPTIYDKKYMNTTDGGNPSNHTYDYILDEEGNRLIYVVRTVRAGVFSGNFYIANDSYTGAWIRDIRTSGAGAALPAGITEVTGVPSIKEDERSWISLVVDLDTFDYTGNQLKEVPYIAGISTYQSATLFIDSSGNLYKTSLDGSGTIAWGWDYSVYERSTAGNNATYGLYNFYCYEIMYMRGAPNVAFTEMTIDKEKTKIYLVEDSDGKTPTDTVTVTAKVPGEVTSTQLNFTATPRLLELKYVFIPYDTDDMNFHDGDFTREEFEAAYNSGLYDCGDLLDPSVDYIDGTYNFDIEVGSNGRIWVLGSDNAYTRTQDYRATYLADNFYTPLEINHRGVGEIGTWQRILYEPTDDNVVKTAKVYGEYTDNDPIYGIPLDAKGGIIADAHFGFDEVTVSKYSTLPGGYDAYWEFRTVPAQLATVVFTLNDLMYLLVDSDNKPIAYVHDFFYDCTGEPELDSLKTVEDSDGDNLASPGEVLNYTIRIENTGTAPAFNVAVQDTLANLLPYVEACLDSVVTMDNNGTVTNMTIQDLIDGFEIYIIEEGWIVTITFSVQVLGDLDVNVVEFLSNMATIDDNEITEEIETGAFELDNKKEVFDANDDGYASPGEALTYVITIKNIGKAAAYDVSIQDTLADVLPHIDEGLTTTIVIDNDGSITMSTIGDLVAGLTIDEIAGGKTVTISFGVTVKSDLDLDLVASLANKATINDEDVEVEIPTGEPRISANKAVNDSDGDGYASPGEELTYTITIVNNGAMAALDVLIQDELTEVLKHVDDPSANPVDIDNDGNVSQLTVADLIAGFNLDIESGATVTITFKVRVKDDLNVEEVEEISNVATIGDKEIEIEIPTGKPDLQISKAVEDSDEDGYASPGEVLYYTITIENTGRAQANDVFIQDTLATVLPHVEDPSTNVVTIDNAGTIDTITVADLIVGYTIDVIKGGDTVTIKFSVTVLSTLDVEDVTNIANTVTIGDEETSADIDTGNPKLDTRKEVADENNDGYASPSETLTYTITITNNGLVAAQNVAVKDELTDVLPAVEDPSANTVVIDNDGTISTKTVQDLIDGFTIASIEAGKTVTITFQVTVKEDLDVEDITVISNTVTVDDDEKETEIPTGEPNPRISKTVSDEDGDGYASPNEVLTYTITLENTGEVDAVNVHVQDTLEDMLPCVIDPSANVLTLDNDGTVTLLTVQDLIDGFEIALLESGKTATLTFTVTVIDDLDIEASPIIYNKVKVNKYETEAEIPTGKPILDVTKEVEDADGDGFASPGEVLTYTITISNTGLAQANNVMVQDTLSTVLPYVVDPSANVVTIDNGGVPDSITVADLIAGYTIDVIKSGDTVTFTFSVTVIDDLDVEEVEEIANVVVVDDNDIEAEIPTGAPDLAGSKEVIDANGDDFASPGETLTYIISVRNNGNVSAYDIVIQDPLTDVMVCVDELPTASIKIEYDGTTVTDKTIGDLQSGITIAEIAAGKTVIVSFEVTVKSDLDLDTYTNIANTALIDGEEFDVDIPTGDFDLEVNKTVSDASGDGFASPGERLTYTITIENKGLVAAHNVFVQDVLIDVVDHVDNPYGTTVVINNNGNITTRTVQSLVDGFEILEIGPGAVVTITFNVDVKEDLDLDVVSSLRNMVIVDDKDAEVEIPTGDDNPVINKTVVDANGDGFASPGEVLTYTITIKNIAGISIYDIWVQDTLSEVLNHVDDPSGDALTILYDTTPGVAMTVQDLIDGFYITEIESGVTVYIIFDVTVKIDLNVIDVPVIANVATINEVDIEVEIPTRGAILTGSKEVSDASGDGFASPGEELTYTLTIRNTGNMSAFDVEVKDDLADLIAHIDNPDTNEVKISIDGVPTTSKTVADLRSGFTIDEIEADSVVVITFSVTVVDDLDVEVVTELANKATLGDDEIEIEIPTGEIDLECAKEVEDSDGDGFASPGEVLTYTITVTNHGTVSAFDVIIKDELTDVMVAVNELSLAPVTVSHAGSTVNKTIADLQAGILITEIANGETVVISFTVTVKSDLDTAIITKVANMATVDDIEIEVEIPVYRPILVEVSEPQRKIYLVEDALGFMPTDIVDVKVTIPATSSTMTKLLCVFIPYDLTDANFNLASFTYAQFNAAYSSGAYDCAELLDSMITYDNGVYNFEIEIGGNGKLWIMAEEETYLGDFKYHNATYLADNFYTPLLIAHTGVGEETPTNVELYSATEDNVVKTIKTYPNGYTDTALEYGIPLDAKGNVIVDPYFGYDVVSVVKYDSLPGGLDAEWTFKVAASNLPRVDFTLNDTMYLGTGLTKSGFPLYVHVFDYVHNQNPNTSDRGTMDYFMIMGLCTIIMVLSKKRKKYH